jgi:hypothetical protein
MRIRQVCHAGTEQSRRTFTPDFPFLAQSGHHDCAAECPLLEVKRTSMDAKPMSAFDPEQFGDFGGCKNGSLTR